MCIELERRWTTCLFLVLLLAALPSFGATLDELLAELPLSAGTRWVYAHTHYDGVGGLDEAVVTRSWLTEIRFVRRSDIPAGTLFELETLGREGRIDVKGEVPEAELERARTELAANTQAGFLYYLFRDGYLYEVPAWAVTPGTNVVADSWLRRSDAFATPLPFPLENARRHQQEQRQKLGDRYNGYWSWIISGEREDLTLPYGTVAAAQHLVYPANGGSPRMWIKEGIGVVRESYEHGGSYFGNSRELVEFTAGR